MHLNSEMDAQAESWAHEMANNGRLEHTDLEERGGDGENVAYRCSDFDVEWKNATDDW